MLDAAYLELNIVLVSNVIFRNYSSKTQWVFGLLFEIRHGTSRKGWVYVASFVLKVAVCN